MGTNYYARIIPSKKDRLELINLINNPKQEWNNIRRKFSRMYGSFDKFSHEGGEIHLGKKSYGWKFLWNPNIYIIRNGHVKTEEIEPGHYKHTFVSEPDTPLYLYPLTKSGIKVFIDREDIRIFNEYDEEIDKEIFFKMALETEDENGKKLYDSESYAKENKSYGEYRTEYSNFLESLGFKLSYSDFYSDGLRFSNTTEFC